MTMLQAFELSFALGVTVTVLAVSWAIRRVVCANPKGEK
jgi:hypothetical protein